MKNIVLTTGYSLLTAFFLCTPPLCAQEKVLDRMTRSEARQEILRHTEIKDHVTFYHSNDKDIYVVYDLISSGNKEKMLQGKTILLGILDAFESTRNQSRPLEVSFFAREKFFDSIRILKENKLMDAELRQLSESLVSQMSFCEERGPNNRAANYAMGALAAARLFPKHKDAKLWKAYAEAVWNDWYEPGDSYEPAYVAHNIPRLIALGVKLGKQKELKGDKLKQVYYKFRNHVSSSGLVCSTGDGEPYDQESYVKAFDAIMEVCPDPTILWALKKTYLAGNMKTGRLPEEAFEKAYPQYAGMEAKAPELQASVQSLFPATYQSKDRLILAPSRKEGAPFAQFWIQDDCNVLYHGGISDTRGDLIHYEVGGTMIIADRGRYEWPAWNNTLLVSEPDAQYPFRQTTGVYSGRWYHSSANMRVTRGYMPSKRYTINSQRSTDVHFALTDQKAPYGYMWGNPEAVAGNNDLINLHEIRLEFALLPTEGEESVGKVFPGRTWFGGYEKRNVCPSDVPVDIYISDLFIAGDKGEKILVPFDKLTDKLSFGFVAPDKTQQFPETELAKEDYTIVTDAETGKQVLRIRTKYGRTVLRIKMNEQVNVNEDYSRIGLSYKYVTPIKGWTRVPILIAFNDNDMKHNLRLDRQQGGILTDAKAENKAGDSYGSVSYKGIWTHDSSWTRSTLLTEEGFLIVLDEFLPGKAADKLVAGPVWHVPSAPRCGNSDGATADWFDASLLHYPAQARAFTDKYGEGDKCLFIAFDAPAGSENGIQYQPKHWKNDDYAVYSKCPLEAGKNTRWLSVLAPHSKNTDAIKLSRNIKISNLGDKGYQVNIQWNEQGKSPVKLEIKMGNHDEWEVIRN